MKTFVLTPEQELLRELARELAQSELGHRAERVDQSGAVPEEGMRVLAEAGLLSCMVPEAFGGAGLDWWSQCCVIGESAEQCASTAWAALENAAVAECVLVHGSEEQKARVLPELTGGAFAAVSDGRGLLAKKTPEGYQLSGRLRHVLLAKAARWLVVCAQDGGERLWFLLNSDQKGLSVEEQAPLLGLKGCPAGTLVAEDCQVSMEACFQSEVGTSLRQARALLGAALAVGICHGALSAAIPYANQRIQFGKPVSHFENNQQLLAELLAQAEAARSLVWSAAAVRDADGDAVIAAQLAKAFAGEIAPYLTRKCVQVMGGYGYSREYPVECRMRDAKIMELLGGTTEEMRAGVARAAVVQ